MRILPTWLALPIALALPATALAVPLVSVDADPATPGVQASAEVVLGATFEVDILVADVGPEELFGFQLTLLYDPAVLGALAVVDGGVLPAPLFELDQTLGVGRVSFSEISLAEAGVTGGGVLATLAFQALAVGDSALQLLESSDPAETLILSGLLGVSALCGAPGSDPACEIANGAISVVAEEPPPVGGEPIPEPSAALLFLSGAWVVALAVRRGAR
jgi:hypothetical protein